jgi:uncharacterized membrane protein YkoI
MISKEDAIEIARKRARQNDWAFVEPLAVIERRGWQGELLRFEIETNAGKRGTKARFTVDANSGEIAAQGYIPR